MDGYGLNNIYPCSCKTEKHQQHSLFFQWPLDKFSVYFCDKAAQTFPPMPSKQDQ